MKKICLVLIVVTVLSLLISCDAEPSARRVDPGVISYNNNLYYVQPWNSDFHIYYDYEDPWVYEEVDSVNSPRIKADFPIIMRAWIFYKNYFGDNILLLRSWNAGHLSIYFKEGFTFPKYNEVALSEILLSYGKKKPVIEFSEDADVTWNDIIDYSTSIKHEKYCSSYWTYGKLRDYSTCLLTGRFYVIEVDGVIYICVDRPIQEDEDEAIYYKISEEYQQIFKDAID